MARGTAARGDIVTQTADGVDLNTFWAEFQKILAIQNEQRSALLRALTRPVYAPSEMVIQGKNDAMFEPSSEYGEPVGYRAAFPTVEIGFDHAWRDLAFRYTWLYLAEVSSDQLRASANMALEAYNRVSFRQVMRALFIDTPRVNRTGKVVFPLYNGDAMAAPDYLSQSFGPGHNHYLTTGGNTLDGIDLKAAIDTVEEHGWGSGPNSKLLVLAHPNQAAVIRGYKANVNAPYDFIPGASAPAYLTDLTTVGETAPADYQGIPLIGSFGNAYVAEERLVPAGYVLVVATGGPNSLDNPVGFREHPNASLRGLRLVRGITADYPLVDSIYSAGFGTGVRHRGAAAVLQVTSGPYTAPQLPEA